MVKRLSFIFILTVLCVWTAWGNNVRIIGNVSVEDKDVDNTTQIATVKIKIGWTIPGGMPLIMMPFIYF